MNNSKNEHLQSEPAEETLSSINALDEMVAAEPDNLDYRFELGPTCLKVGPVDRA